MDGKFNLLHRHASLARMCNLSEVASLALRFTHDTPLFQQCPRSCLFCVGLLTSQPQLHSHVPVPVMRCESSIAKPSESITMCFALTEPLSTSERIFHNVRTQIRLPPQAGSPRRPFNAVRAYGETTPGALHGEPETALAAFAQLRGDLEVTQLRLE